MFKACCTIIWPYFVNTTTTLIRPNFHGPKVVVLTGLHCTGIKTRVSVLLTSWREGEILPRVFKAATRFIGPASSYFVTDEQFEFQSDSNRRLVSWIKTVTGELGVIDIKNAVAASLVDAKRNCWRNRRCIVALWSRQVNIASNVEGTVISIRLVTPGNNEKVASIYSFCPDVQGCMKTCHKEWFRFRLNPRGGTAGNSWWGCAAWFSKPWPYFRTKNRDFKIQRRDDNENVA